MLATICAAAVLHLATAATRTISGQAYAGTNVSPDAGTPLYTVAATLETGDGVDRFRTVSTDKQGQPFFTQTVDFDGAEPKAYSFSSRSPKQEGKVTVTPTELVLELTEDGKTKTAREPRPKLFAAGVSMSRLLRLHLAELTAYKPVAFHMVVLIRMGVYALHAMREPLADDEPVPEVKAGKWLRVRIEPESAVARIFAPKYSNLIDATTGQTLFVLGSLPSPEGGLLDKATIHYAAIESPP